MFISLYATRLILNALGAQDFGVFNIVGGSIAMLGFLHVAMTSATQRFMSYSEGEGNLEKQKKIFNVSLILHAIIALALGLILYVAGIFFFNGILNLPENRFQAAHLIYYFMIISTMVTVMTVPYEAVINAHENMLYFSIVGVIESLLKLAVALIVVITLKDKLIVYGALTAGIALIIMIIMRIYCHQKYAECVISPRKYWDRTLMKEMTSFAGWNLITSATSIVTLQGLSIVLNSFFGVILNAAQGIATQISGQLMAFSNTMLKALNPALVKSEGGNDRNRMIKITLTGSKFSFLLFAFFAAPSIIEMPFILKFWLKEVPEWAVLFCRLELTRNLFSQFNIVLQSGIAAEGRIKRFSTTMSILYILPLPFSVIAFKFGAPPFFLYIIWILCWGIGGIFTTLYFSNKNFGFPVKKFLKGVFLPCVSGLAITLILGFILSAILTTGFPRLVTTISLTSVSFLIITWIIILDNAEKNIITSTLKKITKKIKSSL